MPKPRKEAAPAKAPAKKDPRPFFSESFPAALLTSKGIKGPADISKIPTGVRRFYGVNAAGQLQIQVVDVQGDARYTCLVCQTGLTIYVQESGLDQIQTKPSDKPKPKPEPAAKPKPKPKPEPAAKPKPKPEPEDDSDTGDDFDDDGTSFDEDAEGSEDADDGSDEGSEDADDGSDEGSEDADDEGSASGDEDSWEDEE